MRSIMLAGIIATLSTSAFAATAAAPQPTTPVIKTLNYPPNGVAMSTFAMMDRYGSPLRFDGELTQAWDLSSNSYSEEWFDNDMLIFNQVYNVFTNVNGTTQEYDDTTRKCTANTTTQNSTTMLQQAAWTH